MNFFINPTCLSSAFTLPTAIVDNHLKLANPLHLKVLLYVFRNLTDGIDKAKISADLNLDEYDVSEALLYWADAGILVSENSNIEEIKPTKKITPKRKNVDRFETTMRMNNDPKIAYLVNEAPLKFGREFSDTERSQLVDLYDDVMDVSVIMLLIQYAVAKEKTNMRFVQKLALELEKEGIETVSDAEEYLHKKDSDDLAWKTVLSAFGIERRKPSTKEKETASLWIYDWKISKELLVAAYDKCVDTKSKFSFPYVAKIIENWHSQGITSVEEIPSDSSSKDNNNFAAYDLNIYEEMLKQKD